MKVFTQICTVMLIVLFTISASAKLKEVKDCTNTQENDINKVAGWVAENWSAYEDFVENRTGLNIKNCMENRFKKNGKAVCEEATGKCEASKGNNAWANPLNMKIHLCPSFLDRISGFSQMNRRACYAAIMFHEFTHSCDRFEKGSELIDNAAFDFWKNNHKNVTIELIDCGMD